MLRKIMFFLLILILLSGCGKQNTETNLSTDDENNNDTISTNNDDTDTSYFSNYYNSRSQAAHFLGAYTNFVLFQDDDAYAYSPPAYYRFNDEGKNIEEILSRNIIEDKMDADLILIYDPIIYDNIVYFTMEGTIKGLYKYNLKNKEVIKINDSCFGGPIFIYDESLYFYDTTTGFVRTDLDGKMLTNYSDVMPVPMYFYIVGDYIYTWALDGSIYKAAIDGTNIECLYEKEDLPGKSIDGFIVTEDYIYLKSREDYAFGNTRFPLHHLYRLSLDDSDIERLTNEISIIYSINAKKDTLYYVANTPEDYENFFINNENDDKLKYNFDALPRKVVYKISKNKKIKELFETDGGGLLINGNYLYHWVDDDDNEVFYHYSLKKEKVSFGF